MQQSASADKPAGNSSSVPSCEMSTPEGTHNSWAQQRQVSGGQPRPTRRAQYEHGQFPRPQGVQLLPPSSSAAPTEPGLALVPSTESTASAPSGSGQPTSRLRQLGRSVARKISFGVLRGQQQQREPEQQAQGEGGSGSERPGPLARIARGVLEGEGGGGWELASGRVTPTLTGGLLAGDTAGLQRERVQVPSQAALVESTGREEPSALPHAHPEQQQHQQQQQDPEAPEPSSFYSSAGVWERDPRVGVTIPPYYSLASAPRTSSRYSEGGTDVPIGFDGGSPVPAVPEIPERFRDDAAYPSSHVFPPQSPVLAAATASGGPYMLVHKDDLMDAYKQHLHRAIIPQIQQLSSNNADLVAEISRVVEERVAVLLGDFHEHLDQRFGPPSQQAATQQASQPPRRRMTVSSESDAQSMRGAARTAEGQAQEARRQHRQLARQQQRDHVAADEQGSILRTLQHLVHRVGTMQTAQNQLYDEVDSMRTVISNLSESLQGLRYEMSLQGTTIAPSSQSENGSALQRQTQAARHELSIMRNDVQGARADIAATRNNLAIVSDHTNAARLEIAEARADIQDSATESEGSFNVIADMIKQLQRALDDLHPSSRSRGVEGTSYLPPHYDRRDGQQSQRPYRPPSGPITPFAPVPPVPRYDPPAPPPESSAESTSSTATVATADADAAATPPVAAANVAEEEPSFTSFLPLQIPTSPAASAQASAEGDESPTSYSPARGDSVANKGKTEEPEASVPPGTAITTTSTGSIFPPAAAPAAVPASASATATATVPAVRPLDITHRQQQQTRSASTGRVAEMTSVFESSSAASAAAAAAASAVPRLPIREILRRRQERQQQRGGDDGEK